MAFKSFESFDINMLPFFNGGDFMFLDSLAVLLTSGYTWIPLYIALILLVVKNNGKLSHIFFILLCALLCVFLSGGIDDLFVKPYFARLRPIDDPVSKHFVNEICGYRPSGYSFFSAHAANTMSIAVFVSLLVRSRTLTISMLLWSLTNCWTRLYLAVHYLSDVITGIIWGAVVGFLVFIFFMYVYKKVTPKIVYISTQYTSTGYKCTDVNFVLNILALTIVVVLILVPYFN